MTEASEAAPIGSDELEALFAIFPRDGRVVLAVSGGADSTALALLATRWRGAVAQGPDLIAATVDHGLRTQSAEDAARVGAFAAHLRLPHQVLAWEGAKPSTGIEAAARDARYALLCAFARRSGANAIATAHTLDDQAETVLMRLAAGSGPAGLAGMRQRESRDGIVLLRPFLRVRKHRLIATLKREGMSWQDDPMNADPRFARPRLRASAAALAHEGLTPERLGRLATRMARWEEAIATSAKAARDALRLPDRADAFDGWALLGVPEEVGLRVLAAEIQAVGSEMPGPYAPRLERLEALWEELSLAIRASRPLRRTLGGALIAADAEGAVTITRAASRRSRSQAAPGDDVHQD